MLLNAKYDFNKSCDQYLFKLLLGPLQTFWLHDDSASRPIKISVL